MGFSTVRRAINRMTALGQRRRREIRVRRGIFGGTFNPPHWGHLAIAQAALHQAHLQQVIWVPSYHPPHRARGELLSFEHRWQMVQRAIAPTPTFLATDLERQRGDRSFAIDTFTQLQQEYPNSQWFWILGLDSFASLPRWYHSDQLVPQCCWLVAPRAQDVGTPATWRTYEQTAAAVVAAFQQRGIPIHWQWLRGPDMPISSTLIRERLHQASLALSQAPTGYLDHGTSPIHSLVPPSLEDYILDHKLYQDNS